MRFVTGSRGFSLMIASTTFLSLTVCQLPAAADGTEYKVATGDVLTISVYGDPGLTGLFPVSADGTIGYPLLGNVNVIDQTVNEIGARISRDLARHVANRSVAVAVKEYAPIFVVGDVQKPGKYEYRPGMIVLELFALGGGLRESNTQRDTSGIQLIAAQQEYEDMSMQLLSQDIRRVRLEAELNDTEFEYKGDEIGLVRDRAALEKIVASETSLFRLRLSAQQDEKTNLEVQRQNFIQEIDTLQKSNVMRSQQLELLDMDVNASKELVTRGAASESALRERKRELLSMNQQVLESTSFLARAQQNKSEVERRILELKSKRHNDAATELRETSLDIMRLKKKLAFSLQSMAEIGSTARRVSSLEDMIQTKFFIVRQVAGTYSEIAADEHTQVRAGDVVRVRLSVSGRDPVSAAVVTGSVN
ncbi:polysaccharide biosynthesis/export family protein [Agrobacterium salinitolerans]|uniref:Exopolysaccharide biosynthesis protein n=1 Tax=Agrobacterium salinitolerans TaxID=1183413 RepID=A0A9X3KT20_9HYPH|nr:MULTISPECIES: polysaccharide biosynthesis/export family protein [Agrobacterium]MCZ7852679.1 polysaccharide biosynthesis/export family protein [Agrobacterium salinitolerans]MCZ7859504.1 polysaccharide biosynthesis/export family protein [Agrobacterium salinitolerans]MCZ7894406.1 polysaccharide biosynthesis/export family protein [Agrobacterium salinitolerans]MCZ7940410.1 polysaccharide biosynthesis/export family protein [Agrobacterium salinitolerans]MCZ7977470.1 polysaccharide biosynthesis/exp